MSDPMLPFQPDNGSGVVVTANAGSQAIALSKGCRQVLIVNASATTALNFVAFTPGEPVRAANANDQLIAPGRERILSKDSDGIAGAVFCAGVGAGQISSGNGGPG